MTKEESQDTHTLQTLLSNRGLRTHTDFTAFLKAMSDSTHCWNLFKDALLNKEMATPFLEQQVHLVAENIVDTSNAGVCVPVSSEKCEISAGVDLSMEMREVMTEMLLRGWNKLLILGMRRSFVTFFRHAMGDSTIEVQVDAREDAWHYSEEMNGYPVIFVMGAGEDRIPSQSTALVISSEHSAVGPALRELRQTLAQLTKMNDARCEHHTVVQSWDLLWVRTHRLPIHQDCCGFFLFAGVGLIPILGEGDWALLVALHQSVDNQCVFVVSRIWSNSVDTFNVSDFDGDWVVS